MVAPNRFDGYGPVAVSTKPGGVVKQKTQANSSKTTAAQWTLLARSTIAVFQVSGASLCASPKEHQRSSGHATS